MSQIEDLEATTRKWLPTSSSPKDRVDTLLPKAVKEAAEDALVGPAIGVSNEHVHIPAGHLPPAVRATGHTQQPRVEGLA